MLLFDSIHTSLGSFKQPSAFTYLKNSSSNDPHNVTFREKQNEFWQDTVYKSNNTIDNNIRVSTSIYVDDIPSVPIAILNSTTRVALSQYMENLDETEIDQEGKVFDIGQNTHEKARWSARVPSTLIQSQNWTPHEL